MEEVFPNQLTQISGDYYSTTLLTKLVIIKRSSGGIQCPDYDSTQHSREALKLATDLRHQLAIPDPLVEYDANDDYESLAGYYINPLLWVHVNVKLGEEVEREELLTNYLDWAIGNRLKWIVTNTAISHYDRGFAEGAEAEVPATVIEEEEEIQKVADEECFRGFEYDPIDNTMDIMKKVSCRHHHFPNYRFHIDEKKRPPTIIRKSTFPNPLKWVYGDVYLTHMDQYHLAIKLPSFYINATRLCALFKRDLRDWGQTIFAKEAFKLASAFMRYSFSEPCEKLIINDVSDGIVQGTYIHPILLRGLVRWLGSGYSEYLEMFAAHYDHLWKRSFMYA